MNVHAVTGTAIVKLPSFKLPGVKIVSPFVLAGGGAMFFDPRQGSVNTEQTRGAFVYGGRFDVPMAKHVVFRAQYRGFVYKIPDFEMTSLKVDKYTHSAVPPPAWWLLSSTVRLPSHIQGGWTSRLDCFPIGHCCPHAGTARRLGRHGPERSFSLNRLRKKSLAK